MIIAGLTGNIGMGKTTAANMFKRLGYPVQDADQVVHDLMGPNGKAVDLIKTNFPGVVEESLGRLKINRQKLGSKVFGNSAKLRLLESILYPLVNQERRLFLKNMQRRGCPLVILDVPLLFEKGLDQECDVTICVTSPFRVQRSRVLRRPGMTEDKFQKILLEQMPIQDKLKKADYKLNTGLGKAQTLREIRMILAKILN